MKLTDYCILVPINDAKDSYILINTLNGKIHVVENEEVKCMQKWINSKKFAPANFFEKQLVTRLIEANYIFNDEYEETVAIQKTLETCKKRHEIRNQNNHDVVFVITYQCNFACSYCYEADASNLCKNVLTHDMVDRIYHLHQNHLNRITFYGGEPFLLKNKEIVKYIISKEPKAIYSATTNGYYLEEYFDLLQPLKFKTIMVTLDGPQEIHDRNRILKNGKGTFEKVMRGIKLYLEHSLPIKIRMNISNENLTSCLELRAEFIKNFSRQYNSNLLFFELQPVFQLPVEEKKNIEKRIYYAETQGGHATPINSNYNTMVMSTSHPLSFFVNNNERKFLPKYTHCDAESSCRFYDADGNVYSCILALGNPLAAVGTYYPDVTYKSHSMLDRNIETIEECSICKLRFFCGGGCANAVIDSTGNTHKPNCSAIKHDLFVDLPQLYSKYAHE